MESGGRTAPGGLDRIVVQTGKIILFNTTSSFAQSNVLNPQIDSRLAALAATFQLYRFTWLKFTLYPVPTGDSVSVDLGWGLGFMPDEPESSSFPASTVQMMQMPFASFMTGRVLVPQYFTVPRSELLGRNATKWWETDNTASGTQLVDQGKIFIRSQATTTNVVYVLEYRVEFTNPLPASLTFARLKAIGQEESFKRLCPEDEKCLSLIRKIQKLEKQIQNTQLISSAEPRLLANS